MKTGICIAGPAWIVRSRIATPAAHIAAVKFTSSASTISAEQVDAVAVDLHAGGDRDDEQQHADGDRPDHRRERVAGEDAEPVRRGQHQPPREPVLEVRRDPEAGEHAAERRRLQQHEHELERRVARREVEARHVADARQPAREGDEEEQREDQRRQQQLRVGGDLLESSGRRRPPATSQKRLMSAPAASAGPRPSRPRRSTRSTAAKPKPERQLLAPASRR